MPRTPKQATFDDLPRRFVDSFDATIDTLVRNPPRSAANINISPHEARSLIWLGKQGKCVMSEFARGMSVPMSTATHLVDRLVEKGFLVRTRSETDRRIVQLELSAMGKRFDKRFYNHRLACGRILLTSLNTKEQEELIRLLNKASQGYSHACAPKIRKAAREVDLR